MKKVLTVITICVLASLNLFAQIPQGINYQTIVRDNSGAVLSNQNVAFRFSIISNSPTGAAVYREVHNTTTNQLGLVNLIIGQGTPGTGVFTTINWGSAAHYLTVELDHLGGTAFQTMGTQQFMSVPYALSSGGSSTSMAQLTDVTVTGVANGQVLKWDAVQSMWAPANDISGGAGDNWGSQTVQTNSSLSGDGTSSNPISISQQGALNGQVLKWNGSAWMPDTDIGAGSGDNWGTQVVQTNTTLTGNGTSGSPLGVSGVLTDNQTLNISGTTLSISGGNSVTLSTGGGNMWSLNGNTGTNSTNDFIGTTDAQPINFRTNNILTTRFTTKGQIEILNTGSSVFIGENAGSNDDLNNRRNSFIGYQSGMANTTGNRNVAFGSQSFSSNTTGFRNTAIGHLSLNNNTTGGNNISIGSSSLTSNKDGSGNIAIGYYSLGISDSADNNIAIGNESLSYNTTGYSNVAIGNSAMHYQFTGNTTGSYNVALGASAMSRNTTGSRNTSLGYSSLGTNITGDFNTAIGHNADVDVSNRSNVIVLSGNGNIYPNANNQVRIGNNSMTSIGGQVGWTSLSDARIKRNIQSDVRGLEFVMKLKPITFNYDVSLANKLQNKIDTSEWSGKYAIENIRFSGFMAQEVEKAAKESDYSFSGIDKPEGENGLWGLRYSDFTVPLVKAIQEQQEMIEMLKQEIAALKEKLNEK